VTRVVLALAFAGGFVLALLWPSRSALAPVLDPAPDLGSLSARVEGAAAEAGVDPDLLRGLVAAESGGDAKARSGKGAVGLLQLTSETAADEAKALGLRGTPDLYDPATNLRLGARHLARLLSDLGGDVPLALAAYNAGRQHALRWRLRAPDADGLGVVAREGFAETRGHVRRTLRFRDEYRRAGHR